MRIAVEGNIGAGKSGVLEALAGSDSGRFGKIYREPVEQWDLDAFYENPKKHGLVFSLRVLASFDEPYRQDRCVVERCPLSCRHVFTQLLFNDGCLSQSEWDVFKDYADLLGWAPDAIVYVDTPAHVCMERIKGRGRACEAGLDLTHLRRLEFQYDTMVKYSNVPVVRLDGTLPREELHAAAIDALDSLMSSGGARQ